MDDERRVGDQLGPEGEDIDFLRGPRPVLTLLSDFRSPLVGS